MITIFIVATIVTIIIGFLCKKYDIDFDLGGAIFVFIIGCLLGLVVSAALSNPTVEEKRQLDHIIKEMPDGNKAYYVLKNDDYDRIYIDEYIHEDEDVDEPYIIEHRERLAHTKWSVASNTFWSYRYIYYY